MFQAGHVCTGRCATRQSHIVAAMGGRGRRGSFGDAPLILGPNGSPVQRPGGPLGGPGRLIVPGSPGAPGQFSQGRGRPGPPIGLQDDAAGSCPGSLPTANKYRPPPGFMNDNILDPALADMDPQDMLNKLRAKGGLWHTLARFLPVLYRKGFDTNSIAELTGLNPVDQNRWVVAGTVYDSIEQTGDVDPNVLSFFDVNGDELLYHFRFLPAERRAAAAKFIVANNLDERGSEVLARAMKEWDRRPGERTGFSNTPGDCLAFKYLRDAIECRLYDEAVEKIALAHEAADTEEATSRLIEWQQAALATGPDGQGSGSKAVLTVLRLSQDELGFRPLAQVSSLQSVTADEVLSAPTTSQEGAFGVFDIPALSQSQKWVALPQWKALALARHPVAIPLPDCAADPSIVAATKVKTEEEKKRLNGAGLLVVDATVSGPPDPDTFYLVRQPEGNRVTILEGLRISDGSANLIAVVLFLCRPPNRESAITSAELLQL